MHVGGRIGTQSPRVTPPTPSPPIPPRGWVPQCLPEYCINAAARCHSQNNRYPSGQSKRKTPGCRAKPVTIA